MSAALREMEGEELEGTTTMRISAKAYAEIKRLKEMYASNLGKKKVTYGQFILECCTIGEMLMTGQELYEANGLLFHDIETARGEAIRASVKTGKPANPPTIMLKLGHDELLKGDA